MPFVKPNACYLGPFVGRIAERPCFGLYRSPPQSASTALSCAASDPAPGAYAHSIAAVPIVKASAPAARRAATRSAELTIPATTTVPGIGESAPAGGDKVERLCFGRAVGENVDAPAALFAKARHWASTSVGRSAEPRRMAARIARERQIARRAAFKDRVAPPRHARRPSASRRRDRGQARSSAIRPRAWSRQLPSRGTRRRREWRRSGASAQPPRRRRP